MYKIIFAISISFILSQAQLDANLFHKFQKFINKYNKNYSSTEEYLKRYQIFVKNYKKFLSSEKKSYKTEITQFFDLTDKEIEKKYLNFNYENLSSANFSPLKLKASNELPDTFDWRERINFGKFISNQNSCGSNWAYATLEMLEALYAKEKGIYIKLSEQMLIDCDTYDDGCNGGSVINALKWIKENGIMKAEDYPYKGTKSTCKADPSKYIDMKVTGYKQLGTISSSADEEVMKQVLYESGPYTVGINSIGLYAYRSGILDLSTTKCPPNDINHFPLLVGYGTTEKVDYWILKNSWGSSWGERGYLRIARGKGVCGINNSPIIANVSFE